MALPRVGEMTLAPKAPLLSALSQKLERSISQDDSKILLFCTALHRYSFVQVCSHTSHSCTRYHTGDVWDNQMCSLHERKSSNEERI